MLPELSESEPQDLESFLFAFRYPILILLIGILLTGLGVFYLKGGFEKENGGVEVLSATSSADVTQTIAELFIEVSGAVEKPGVYKVQSGARVDDVIQLAGGVTKDADEVWMARSLNRAAKVSDGQKIFIPSRNQQSSTSTARNSTGNSQENIGRTIISEGQNGLVNINSASTSELDSLPGIGSVYAQKIIDQRPYSSLEELLTKKVIPKNTFEKIKEKISVY